MPSLVISLTLRASLNCCTVILVPGTGYVSTLGPLAIFLVSTVPVPSLTAAWMLVCVLNSEAAFCLSSPSCFFFSISLLSLWVEGIGGVWMTLSGRAHYPFLGHFIFHHLLRVAVKSVAVDDLPVHSVLSVQWPFPWCDVGACRDVRQA